jgi:hypothetical protein
MEHYHHGVPARRIEAEEMVIEGEPDILERPIEFTLRQMARATKPPQVVHHRAPQKRPLPDVRVGLDHQQVIEDESVAQTSQVGDSRDEHDPREQPSLAAGNSCDTLVNGRASRSLRPLWQRETLRCLIWIRVPGFSVAQRAQEPPHSSIKPS